MPFDYVNFRIYEIDYHKFFNEIKSKKILLDNKLQEIYLRRWVGKLRKHDEILKKQFSTKSLVEDYISKVQNEREIFQLPTNWGINKVLIHFRVSIANQLVKNYYPQSQMIPITEFQGGNQSIYWTKVTGDTKKYAGSNNPIIVVPYFSNGYHYLVIDGNHRITYKLKHNTQKIATLFISEYTVIEEHLFSSSFDELFYIFNNELVRFASASIERNYSAEQLFNKSYLSGKGFQFS
ncbi:hypothetical protein NIE88_05000 [Sporolactobacillus shoreicorticis]|uniref:ParB/Sulfiredoxin domain-containing protein n=1 Tax=Sporolactobacillus shoreicorticis TaxID=1923877 RepID=A0ABW5RYI5_9BACL|nr:hypothetical protein [Sporolactobacillus shoreicorticis]MCO7125132.1 hypothetical protein [Sporolactobacillus shoreicorticis]